MLKTEIRIQENINKGMSIIEALSEACKEEVKDLLAEGRISQAEAEAALRWIDEADKHKPSTGEK